MNFKERLLKELEELSVRIDRLSNYIINTTENTDTSLEGRQLDLMYQYKWVLELRIKKMMK